MNPTLASDYYTLLKDGVLPCWRLRHSTVLGSPTFFLSGRAAFVEVTGLECPQP